MLCREIIAVFFSECMNAKLGGKKLKLKLTLKPNGNRWVLGLIVRDYVMLNFIAECSCLAYKCLQACYRTAGNSLTVGTYYRRLQGRRIVLQTSWIVLPKYQNAQLSIAQDSSLHSQCCDVIQGLGIK